MKERISYVLHWASFIISILTLIVMIMASYEEYKSPYGTDNLALFFLSFLLAALPTLTGALINYILTGKKNILPWG